MSRVMHHGNSPTHVISAVVSDVVAMMGVVSSCDCYCNALCDIDGHSNRTYIVRGGLTPHGSTQCKLLQ